MNPEDQKEVKRILADTLEAIVDSSNRGKRFSRTQDHLGQPVSEVSRLVGSIKEQAKKLRE